MSKDFIGFVAAQETITAAISILRIHGRRRRRLWCKPRGGIVSSFGFVLLDILHSLRSFFLNRRDSPASRTISFSEFSGTHTAAYY
jgi:hypothetical protein